MYEVLTALDLLTFSLIKIAKCLEKYISLTILASSVSLSLMVEYKLEIRNEIRNLSFYRIQDDSLL